jgi:hypothetical protein
MQMFRLVTARDSPLRNHFGATDIYQIASNLGWSSEPGQLGGVKNDYLSRREAKSRET